MNREEKRRRKRKAGESGALEKYKSQGGAKNAAFGGKVDKNTPGARGLKGNRQFEGTKRDSNNPKFKNYRPEEKKTRRQLNQYDLEATGVGEGQQRLSRGDVRGLARAGYSRKQLINFADNLGGAEGKDKTKEGFVGMGARNLIDKWAGRANTGYFKNAIERHGVKDLNAAELKAKYDKATEGLDKDLAFKALEGGRFFGESDRARYDKLLAERDKIKTDKSVNDISNAGRGNNRGKIDNSFKAVNSFNNAAKNNVNIKADQSRSLGNKVGNVSGDNNVIDNSSTDNSFNLVEGSTVFNYQSTGGNSYEDTPMSAMSMGQALAARKGGLADSIKSTTAYSKLNDNLQSRNKFKKGNTPADQAIRSNARDYVDPDPENQINASPFYLMDKSDQYMANVFGDPGHWRMPKVPNFNLSEIRRNNFDALRDKD